MRSAAQRRLVGDVSQLVSTRAVTLHDGPEEGVRANDGYEPTGGIAVTVSYDPRQLPRLWHWRMLAPGMYLTGIEPANCGILGRAEERAAGTLRDLAPGERTAFDLDIRVSLGAGVSDLIARLADDSAA